MTTASFPGARTTGEEIRGRMIAAGALRPGRSDELTPLALPPGVPILRIDDIARAVVFGTIKCGRRWLVYEQRDRA